MDTLRQEGLARCSRPFALPNGGARIVTMQLGPGYVRGDRFECVGSVGSRAELVVTAQSATRALGRGAESLSTTVWDVGAGGTLRLFGEPLVLYAGVQHRASLDIELQSGATLALVDVVAAREPFVRVATRLRVRSGRELIVHDAFVLTPERCPGAVGSAFFLRGDISEAETRSALAAADAAASAAQETYGVRIGIGSPARGGVSVRVLGKAAANVRASLVEIVARIVSCEEALR